MPTLVSSTEVESGTIASNTSGTAAGTFTTASITVAAGDVLVVYFATGTPNCTRNGVATATGTGTGAIAMTSRYLREVSATTPQYVATGVIGAAGTVTVSQPWRYTSTSGSTVAWLVVEVWRGAAEPTNVAGTATAITTASTTAGATVTFTQNTATAALSWIGTDYNGRSTSGVPTYSTGSTQTQTYLPTTAGLIAGYAAQAAFGSAGTKTIGFASFSTGAGTRKFMFVVVEVPDAPAVAAIATLVDDFTADTGLWDVNGSSLESGHALVNVSSNGAGGAVYSSRRSKALYSWSGSALTLEVTGTPAPGAAANAQLWMQDPSPSNTVDRLGFEYRAAADAIDCIGQSGASYTAIGTTASFPYDPVAWRWVRLRHTGSSVVWESSPDGLTWTVRRTLSSVPGWTTRAPGLRASIEGFRTAGTDDFLIVDRVNVAQAATPTTPPTGSTPLQTRTLAELRAWRSWCTAANAKGWVGEFGTVTLFGKYNDATQQQQWDALLDVYLTELDATGMHGTVWSSGREFDQGYPLGMHVGVAKGDPLTIANTSASVVAAHPTRSGAWRGVNLAGHENGIEVNGGGTVRSAAPLLHTAADFAFLAANNVDTVRLPLAWERLQPTLGGALDTTAMTQLGAMLIAARQWGVRVLLDIHGYGRYTLADGSVVALGGATLTNALFADLWTRLVTWVRADPGRSDIVIGFGLMNEPHDLPGGAKAWERASQAALDAVRATGDTRLVLVAGHGWSSLTNWSFSHPTGWITDSAANFAYEAHHYFDTQSALGARSGTYQQSSTGPILTYSIENTAASTPQEPDWVVDTTTTGVASWTANLAAADAVAAGYANTPWNRQDAAGNDTASLLAWPPPTDVAPYGRPGRALPMRLRDASRRYEVEPAVTNLVAGDWRWIGFAFCVDPDTDRSATGYQVVWQLRPDDSTGSPPVSLEVFRDGGLHVTGGYNRPNADGSTNGSTYQYRQQLLPLVEPRRWYSVVMFLGVWQAAGRGRFDVWVDGVPVLANFRPPPGTTWPTNGTKAYPKNGVYHDPVNRGATVWFADHRHGNGYGAVDPTKTIAEYRAAEPSAALL